MSPKIYKMIKVKTPEKTMVARTMIDTGNTVNSSAVISEKFHKQLGVGFLNMRTRKIGTAKENSSLMRIGRSNQMELRIDGIKKKMKLVSFSDQRVKGHSISFIKAQLPDDGMVDKTYYVDHKALGRSEVVGAFYKKKRGVQRIAVLNNSDKDVIIKKRGNYWEMWSL